MGFQQLQDAASLALLLNTGLKYTGESIGKRGPNVEYGVNSNPKNKRGTKKTDRIVRNSQK